MEPEKIRISDFSYDLPAHQIASFPLARRDASRLLVYRNGHITDDQFAHLDHHLPEGATLVLNDTRVIEARLLFQKPTGGVIEIFCLEPFGQSIETALGQQQTVSWQCLIGGASKWKPGQVLTRELNTGEGMMMLEARYVEKVADSFVVSFSWPGALSFSEVLHQAGAMPLPPYMKRAATAADEERYQTVFGTHEGSVAAPTAALHFTPETFAALHQKNIEPAFITLHVGAGTFKPVKSATMAEHHMHREPFSISLEVLKRLLHSTQIVAVGTTSLRTLESLYWIGRRLLHTAQADWELSQWEAYALESQTPHTTAKESLGALIGWLEKNKKDVLHCSTSLIIVPDYRFYLPEALVTNFHQPQSTLLLLVAAFIGPDWTRVYQHALDHQYRFLSYGDSSVLYRSGTSKRHELLIAGIGNRE